MNEKFKSYADFKKACHHGKWPARRAAVATIQNFGCEHLTEFPPSAQLWQRSLHGLDIYIESLCSEYGLDESDAFREVLEEVNSFMTPKAQKALLADPKFLLDLL